jgi:putative Mg2+ transporter-C (MgtC) family protein
MDIFEPQLITAGLNVLVALLLGMLLGIERKLAHKTAGLRTYGLVAMGSALFIVTAQLAGQSDLFISGADIMRVAAGVITGIGFLCAGSIIFRDQTVVGAAGFGL